MPFFLLQFPIMLPKIYNLITFCLVEIIDYLQTEEKVSNSQQKKLLNYLNVRIKLKINSLWLNFRTKTFVRAQI